MSVNFASSDANTRRRQNSLKYGISGGRDARCGSNTWIRGAKPGVADESFAAMSLSLPLRGCVFHSFANASGGYVWLAGNIRLVLRKVKRFHSAEMLSLVN